MEKYKILISEVNLFLKPYGFKKKGHTFFFYKGANIGMIDFQKSKSSDAASSFFTINLGVYSNALKSLDSFDVKSTPSISDCHWRKRIGFLLPTKQDHWWGISESTSLSDLLIEIVDVLKSLAVPEIQKCISDEYLEKSWAKGISEGLTEQQMYLYLIALLKFNNRSELQSKVKELISFSRGKPFYSNVIENLQKIGIKDV